MDVSLLNNRDFKKVIALHPIPKYDRALSSLNLIALHPVPKYDHALSSLNLIALHPVPKRDRTFPSRKTIALSKPDRPSQKRSHLILLKPDHTLSSLNAIALPKTRSHYKKTIAFQTPK